MGRNDVGRRTPGGGCAWVDRGVGQARDLQSTSAMNHALAHARPASALLVDDDERLLRGLARVLRGCGYEVETTPGAREALARLGARPFSVVISDYDMPGMTGRVLLGEIARRWPRTGRVLMSGAIDLEAVASSLDGIVQGYLAKPPSAADVVPVVERASSLALERAAVATANSRLPEVVPSGSVLEAARQVRRLEPTSLRRRRMLVLGDAAFARELERAAGELCSTLVVAEDVALALEWLARAPVDLCFIDADRLGGSASDTVTLLARARARADLIIAAHPSFAASALGTLRAGAADLLSRPLASVDVEDAVARAEQRRSRAAGAAVAAAALEVHAAGHARLPRAVAKAVCACLDADGASLLVVGPDGALALAGESEGRGAKPELLELACRAAAATRPEVVSGWRDHDPQVGGLPTLHGHTSSLVVPLVADGAVLGVITATRNALRPPYVREDLELASRLAEHVTVALQKSHLVRDVAQAAQAGAAGQLAAGMVHEINNPLSCILGNLDFAREKLRELAARELGGASEGVLQSLADAERGALRIMDVVSDIRVISHCEDSTPSIFDLSDAVRSALRVAGAQLEATSSVSTDLTPLRVRGNPGQLTQVILSLLLASEEAMRAVDRERRALRISSWRDGERAVLRVVDTGPALTEDYLAGIFEPSVGKTGDRRGGLGLYLSRDVVARHGGSLAVGSSDDGGAVFTISLPLADHQRGYEAA